MGVIYKTTNLIENKIYIGQDSKNNTEYYGSGRKLKAKIAKYGKDNFIKEILEECDIDKLNDREVYWISYYDSMNPNIGYNLTSGGSQHVIFSDETRKKLSNANKGRTAWNKGIPMSKEAKFKASIKLKGRILSDEHKKKISQSASQISDVAKLNRANRGFKKGHIISDDIRLKISNTLKNQPTVVCVYCNKATTKSNISRWHNNNCKYKPNDIILPSS